ncbi:hypothetical protein DSI35_26810, partial [Mycobacterium tuberculosis]
NAGEMAASDTHPRRQALPRVRPVTDQRSVATGIAGGFGRAWTTLLLPVLPLRALACPHR